jgi:hypothetical protein
MWLFRSCLFVSFFLIIIILPQTSLWEALFSEEYLEPVNSSRLHPEFTAEGRLEWEGLGNEEHCFLVGLKSRLVFYMAPW